jgi:hypothetical protein
VLLFALVGTEQLSDKHLKSWADLDIPLPGLQPVIRESGELHDAFKHRELYAKRRGSRPKRD